MNNCLKSGGVTVLNVKYNIFNFKSKEIGNFVCYNSKRCYNHYIKNMSNCTPSLDVFERNEVISTMRS